MINVLRATNGTQAKGGDCRPHIKVREGICESRIHRHPKYKGMIDNNNKISVASILFCNISWVLKSLLQVLLVWPIDRIHK